MSVSSSKGVSSVGGSSLNASASSLIAMRSSSMESLESTMSTTESTIEAERNRLTTVLQENAVLKSEVELYKLKVKNLMEENRRLRQASVNIQAQAEQEEEFISNTLLKKIHSLKKEKETLAMNYEQEEEFLTNDLSRKLAQLQQEKVALERTLEQEQEQQISKLTRKIDKLERDVKNKQCGLDQLRREKIDLENTLEQEQEMLVNKLWKKMEKVEREKRDLEARLGSTPPPSPSDKNNPAFLNSRILQLSEQVIHLRKQLETTDAQNLDKIQQIVEEERALKEENVRLQRRLQRETQRREELTRQLSESESSLEMEDERHFNEMSGRLPPTSPSPYSPSPTRRSVSPSPATLLGPQYPAARVRTSSYGSTSYGVSNMGSASTSALSSHPPVMSHRLRAASSGGSPRDRPTTR